jgi:hypothetical protein
MMIYYLALPFVRLENGGLVPGEAVECPHSSAVLARADAMVRSEASAGAVALARIDSPGVGDLEDAMILKTFGDVPDDLQFVTRRHVRGGADVLLRIFHTCRFGCELITGLRSILVDRHAIFYQISPHAIEIVPVVHQRENIESIPD